MFDSAIRASETAIAAGQKAGNATAKECDAEFDAVYHLFLSTMPQEKVFSFGSGSWQESGTTLLVGWLKGSKQVCSVNQQEILGLTLQKEGF